MNQRLSLVKTYLDVPYHDKKFAKLFGARWDKEKKLWYCLGRLGKLNRYIRDVHRVYFYSNYADKEFIKELRCYYDGDLSCWYTYNIYLTDVSKAMIDRKLRFDIVGQKK